MKILRTFLQEDIGQLVPHRFENMLADRVDMMDDEGVRAGKIELTIQKGDRLGRDIFTKTKQVGKRVVLSPIFSEILAIGSVVCSLRTNPELPVFFTSISKFRKTGDLLLDQQVIGHVRKVKDKGGFLVCDGELKVADTVICTATLMAFFPEAPVEATDKSSKKISTTPVLITQSYPIYKDPAVKRPDMVMADDLVHIDLEQGLVVAQYLFPVNHPLVKGHFPGNPIWMGVLQWMTVEDVVLGLSQFLKESRSKTGHYRVTGDAELIHKDGGFSVAEIKGFEVEVTVDVDGFLNHTELVGTEKVMFRDSVVPGQRVYIILKNLEIE